MRIGLNLLHTMPEIGSGGWNYIQNLVAALGEYDGGHEYVAFVTKASVCLVPHSTNFEPVVIDLNPLSRLHRIMYENSALQFLAAKHRLDIMHWFANTHSIVNAVPSLVTVYDLQPFWDLYSFSKAKRFYLRTMMTYTARGARMLLPMSEATATELNQVLKVERTRMSVIPPCIGSEFQPAKSSEVIAFRLKYGLPENFWLYVAHQYPHKNHIRLLQAYHELKLKGFKPWPLVLRGDPAGGENEIAETIANFSLTNDVTFMPRLSSTELPVLFSSATAMVYPSLYEGGGLPVVEALACGLPAVASRIPAIREFADDAVYYFDPTNIESITKAMYSFQNDKELRMSCQEKGVARAMIFRRSNIAQKLNRAYVYAGGPKQQSL